MSVPYYEGFLLREYHVLLQFNSTCKDEASYHCKPVVTDGQHGKTHCGRINLTLDRLK